MLATFSLCRNKKSPARSARLAWRCIAHARLAVRSCQDSTRPTRCLRARDGPCYAMLALPGALSQIGQNGRTTCEATCYEPSLGSFASWRRVCTHMSCHALHSSTTSHIHSSHSRAPRNPPGPLWATDSALCIQHPAVHLFRLLLSCTVTT